ncbi:hypothetical protein JB92DRAFT_2081950 [Gautieria morchelliformis]|nr:hypothetical protein JB92DRAFT_2081950 [Gautieria morchelliformis]
MAGKEPCLCVPSCTKALGRVQRERHRKRVQAALLTATEKQYEAFPSTILRSPRKQNFQPDQDLRRRISLYFAWIYDRDAAEIRNLIPLTMTRWGKVRIANGGDKIRARCAVT